MQTQNLARLLSLMQRLRDPINGCSWDVKQTFESIAPYTLEEAYEVLDAIEKRDMDSLRDELGDLLLQVVFHSQIAADQGSFDFDAVAKAIADKIERRHPHVFSNQTAKTGKEVQQSWNQRKLEENRAKNRGQTPGLTSILDGVPANLPALISAVKHQEKAATVGFEWPDYTGGLLKIDEELAELKSAIASRGKNIDEEFGDLLFSICNLSRYFKVSPELSLMRTIAKFKSRFNYIESILKQKNEDIASQSLQQLEDLWSMAKKAEQKAPGTPTPNS